MAQDTDYFRRYREANRARIRECYHLRRAGKGPRPHLSARERFEVESYASVLTPSERVEMLEFEAWQQRNLKQVKYYDPSRS